MDVKQTTLLETALALYDDRSAVTMVEYVIMGLAIATALVLAVPPVANAVSSDIALMANAIGASSGS